MNKAFKVLLWALLAIMLIGANTVQAAPANLDGLSLVNSWVDTEGIDGDMPPYPDLWGQALIQQPGRVGIWVQYENGLTSWATYSGVDPGEWETCCGVVVTEDSADGWLAGAVLHGVGRDDLPMAWVSASNPWSNNFDLDYDSGFGGDWRASSGGWGSVEIALYSNAEPVEAVSVPTLGGYGLSVMILLLAGVGWVAVRRS